MRLSCLQHTMLSETKGNDNLLEVQILHRSDYSEEGKGRGGGGSDREQASHPAPGNIGRARRERATRSWKKEGEVLLEKASTRIA